MKFSTIYVLRIVPKSVYKTDKTNVRAHIFDMDAVLP